MVKKIIIVLSVAFSFLAGALFAETYLPLVAVGQSAFAVPVKFEGEFALQDDGTGTCNGSFVVDPEVWDAFERGAGWNGSVWTGIGEIFDGAPYGPDEEDEPAYSGLWNFITYMEDRYPWVWRR